MTIPRINQITGQIAPITKLNIPNISIWDINTPSTVAPYVPVTVYIGKPIVDIPGCVEVHPENKWPDGNKNKTLAEDDKTVTYCDAHTPSFTPMNYEPEQLIIVRDIPAPEVQPPPDAPTPPTPDTSKAVTEEDVPCPGPTSPRIGALGPSEKEKVVGHELQDTPQGKICVALYEDIGPVEQYLPSASVASTTATIALVATSSALLAKPLADLLLKVFKPAIKQAMGKINKALGKTPYKPTQAELKTNEYRVKKGLLGINFAKDHAKRIKSEKKSEKEQQKRLKNYKKK